MPVGEFMAAIAATGYAGPLSLEIFNDQFRAGSAVQTAVDGLRSLILLEDQLAPDWPKLIASVSGTKTTDAEKVTKASSLDEGRTLSRQDVAFRSDMNASQGWIDLELLLRTLAKLHAQPLLLSMPIAGDVYDQKGISHSARENFYVKLRALAQRYHFPLVDFEGHDEDPDFLYHHQSHLTAKGWIYYDRALDDFFHGRAPRS